MLYNDWKWARGKNPHLVFVGYTNVKRANLKKVDWRKNTNSVILQSFFLLCDVDLKGSCSNWTVSCSTVTCFLVNVCCCFVLFIGRQSMVPASQTIRFLYHLLNSLHFVRRRSEANLHSIYSFMNLEFTSNVSLFSNGPYQYKRKSAIHAY